MGKKSQPAPQVTRCDLPNGVIAVLPTESEEDLQGIVESLEKQFEPKTPTERFFVGQMIHAQWKIARFRRLESEALDWLLEGDFGPADPDRRVIRELEKPGNILEKIERLVAAAERSYSKAVRELERLRSAAAKAEKQNEPKSAAGAWLHAELAKIQNEPMIDPFSIERPSAPPRFNPNPFQPPATPLSRPPTTE